VSLAADRQPRVSCRVLFKVGAVPFHLVDSVLCTRGSADEPDSPRQAAATKIARVGACCAFSISRLAGLS